MEDDQLDEGSRRGQVTLPNGIRGDTEHSQPLPVPSNTQQDGHTQRPTRVRLQRQGGLQHAVRGEVGDLEQEDPAIANVLNFPPDTSSVRALHASEGRFRDPRPGGGESARKRICTSCLLSNQLRHSLRDGTKREDGGDMYHNIRNPGGEV